MIVMEEEEGSETRGADPIIKEALGFKRKRSSQKIGLPSRSERAKLVAVVYRDESVKKLNVDSSSGVVQEAEKMPSKLSIQKKTASSPTAKALLKDICDAEGWNNPSYSLCKEEGPDHQKMFTFMVTVKVDGISLTNLECFGKPKQRKKAAQEAAAEGALWYLKHLGCLPES